MSPFERGTNDYFQNLQRLSEKMDAINFFVNLLQSSIKMCAVDLVQFPAYWIDYHLRRCFNAKQHEQGKEFRNRFVGKAKSKPFKGTNAEQIRYVYLLKARTDERTPSDEAEAYEALLVEAENALLESMKHCQCPPMEASELRAELQAFFVGVEKCDQDHGRHLFTDLIYQDRRNSLDKQCLEDPIFPPRRDDAFDLNNVQVLLNLGLKVIALADLERRIGERRTTDIVACTPRLNRVAVCLVRAFLQKHVNISYKFKYDSMIGLLEGASSSMVKEFDLNDLRMALSPDGQALVLEDSDSR